MKRVVIESPYAGNIARNIAYARLCCKDALARGEAPLLSHLLYTQPDVLNDDDPEQRKLGIGAGHAWIGVAHEVVFYNDFGMSKGMEIAFERAIKEGTPTRKRGLGDAVCSRLRFLYPD